MSLTYLALVTSWSPARCISTLFTTVPWKSKQTLVDGILIDAQKSGNCHKHTSCWLRLLTLSCESFKHQMDP